MKETSKIKALYIVALLFFLLGFSLGINGILIPLLKNVFQLTNAGSYLILTATFSTFVIFSYPSGRLIQRYGYKKSITYSFVLFAIGLYLYIPSGKYQSFALFLIASFIAGMGNTLLQAAINPYITILGPIDTATRRMCLITIVNRIGWAIAPLFLSVFIDITSPTVPLENIILPFYAIVLVFVLLGIFSYFAPFPEIEQKKGDKEKNVEATMRGSWIEMLHLYPHLYYALLALFFYVGIDTLCLVSIIQLAESIGLNNPEQYMSYTVVGIILGCIFGAVAIPRYISQIKAFRYGSLFAFITSIAIPLVEPRIVIFLIPCLVLFMSFTWGTVWAIAIDGLGEYTKMASSFLVSAIVGGALMPVAFGFCSDISDSMQTAYWLFVPCIAFLLYYAFRSYKFKIKID